MQKVNGDYYLKIKQATKQGWINYKVGGAVNLSFPNSKTRRGRVIDGGGISGTLTCTEIPFIIELWKQ